jgi:hypothetical protein
VVTKTELHKLIDELPDGSGEAAARYLTRLRDDPFLALLESAPVDQEPLTDEDRAAIELGREEHRTGKTTPWEVVRRELLGE